MNPVGRFFETGTFISSCSVEKDSLDCVVVILGFHARFSSFWARAVLEMQNVSFLIDVANATGQVAPKELFGRFGKLKECS